MSVYDLAKDDAWKEQFSRVFSWLAFFLVFVGLGISVFGDEVIELMARNPSFWFAASVVPTLVLAYGLREAADFFRNVLYINKRSGLIGRLALACALVNLALNLLLIPAFGYAGAAVCTLLTWALYFIFCLKAQHEEHAIALPWLSIGAIVVGALLAYQASTFVPEHSILVRWGGNAACILVFLGGVLVSGYFRREEKAFALAAMRKALGRGGSS